MSKASKKRDCPAVGHGITAAECGEHRHSRYACPPQCPHNPFAPSHYSEFLKLEGDVDHKTMGRLLEDTQDRAAMEKRLHQARNDRNIHALHAFYSWNLFFAQGTDGLTCCQRWEKAGFPNLKNDERVLLGAKMQTRVALLEIHRVLDGERVEAVDLLAPGTPPMVFQDRSLAGMAVRFAPLVSWIYPLPHYWRLSGSAALIPDMGRFTPQEVVAEIVLHNGGPVETEATRRWLAENFVRFDDALHAAARLRRMKMFAGMDARYGKAVYELKSPFAECRQLLDGLPEVEAEDLSDAERQEGFADGRVWFLKEPPLKAAVLTGGRAVLGRVLLGQSHWRVEAMGGERFAQLRKQFEQCLGSRVRFMGERLDDLGANMAAKEPSVNESLVPPVLLDDPQKMLLASSRIPPLRPGLSPEDAQREFMRAADRAFLDDQIPALDNRTPREAARDPALRPKLIHLLKQRIRQHDEQNLETGDTDDINWMPRELGLDEIIFDPPPWRPPLQRSSGKSLTPEDEELFDAPLEPDPSYPPAPSLPETPLSLDEAAKRLDDAMEAFDTAAEAEDAIYASGLTLIDDASELTAETLSDDEFSMSVPFLLQAALALVPPRHRAPRLDFNSLQQQFLDALDELETALEERSPNALMKFHKQSRQPNLMLLLMSSILESGAKAPKQIRPDARAQGVILALVRAVVDELHDKLRGRSLHS